MNGSERTDKKKLLAGLTGLQECSEDVMVASVVPVLDPIFCLCLFMLSEDIQNSKFTKDVQKPGYTHILDA